ncbi:uncharacterized protein LOC117534145 isoform X2 [Gymnodraco acuticeps]|uniref:Uncharacterized protein LOC117534145 isoform X2 n=1 Tax=Gymnodraco acuticeps TaxID=8218 RepID=A0A6P8T4G3_GYMAC|nr:uncharacterized protein LOC117534145 isoform X2 [Gymnodraco acuticeps]
MGQWIHWMMLQCQFLRVLMHSLTRDDLRDLFPGPEHFLRRKRVWSFISPEDENPILKDKDGPSETGTPPCRKHSLPPTSTPLEKKRPKLTLQLPSPPEYVIYTDSELEQARRHYFEMARTGRERECVMSKELSCRLVRNTLTSMISILRASPQGEELHYPSNPELTAMAKKVVEYYPMLQDKDEAVKHTTIHNKLKKRLLNVKSPQKRQGPAQERGRPKKRRCLDLSASDSGKDYDADSSDAGGSTIILDQTLNSSDENESTSSTVARSGRRLPNYTADQRSSMVIRSPNSHQGAKKQLVKALHGTLYPAEDPEPGEEEEVDKDSLQAQARHFKTLHEMYKNKKQNKDAVSQLLDLEFEARRLFIDSDVLKVEDRHTKVMSELRRILDKDNHKYIAQVKKRWDDFVAKVQFYGVLKKAMKPPMTLDRVEFSIALFKALPTLFPSPAAPPKKLGHASEALIHVLQPTEDPTVYLQKRSLSSPILLVDDSNCLVAIGTTPITTFAKQDLHEGKQPQDGQRVRGSADVPHHRRIWMDEKVAGNQGDADRHQQPLLPLHSGEEPIEEPCHLPEVSMG